MHAKIAGRRFCVNFAPHSAALFVFSFYGLSSFCVFPILGASVSFGASLAVRGGPVAARRAFWVSLGVSGCLFGMFPGYRVAGWDVSGLSGGPHARLLGGHWGSPGVSRGHSVGRRLSPWVSGCSLVIYWVSRWACYRVPGAFYVRLV